MGMLCPNGQHGLGGTNRESFIPTPSVSSPLHMRWYFFVGQLIGLALRQRETQLAFNFTSALWKPLADEPTTEEDLAAFDSMCQTCLQKLRHIDREGVDEDVFADVIFETFT